MTHNKETHLYCYIKCYITRTYRRSILLPVYSPGVSSEERIQNVERILRKEAEDINKLWINLGTAAADWQQQLELALERLVELQATADQLEIKLQQAEIEKNSWDPVENLLVDNLSDQIDMVKVSVWHHTLLIFSMKEWDS